MNIQISSRAFSRGFDITTPSETLSAAQSPFGELLISNASGTQIARVAKESLFGSVYDIIISGGELYQFDQDKSARRRWTCTGGGRTFQLWEERSRRFVIEAESQRIAECSRTWLSNDYVISVLDEAEFKLVACIFLALSLSQDRGSFVPA